MSVEPDLAEGTTFAGYRLVRLLGKGGMGTVFEAERLDGGERLALKILPRAIAQDPLVLARFEREAKVATHLRHPHVIDVKEAGTHEGRPFLAMELLQGEDLAAVLDVTRPLPIEQILDIILPVCAAVGAAHDGGVIHRDIKPENIFLARVDGRLTPKLLDFGIAKVADALAGGDDLTKTATLLGTPYYMPPEQIRRAKHIDTRSDVYALGVILYECATGERPFESNSLYNLLMDIVSGPLRPPRAIVPELPEAFEQVVLRAMNRTVEERIQNVYLLGEALLPFASEAARAQWADVFAEPQRDSIVVPEPAAEDAKANEDAKAEAEAVAKAEADAKANAEADADAKAEAQVEVAAPVASATAATRRTASAGGAGVPAWALVVFAVLVAMIAYWATR